MPLYDSTLRMVRDLPASYRGMLVLRHSVRHPILSEDEVFTAGLTEAGVKLAEELGTELGKLRNLGRLLSSPVVRCLDTAAALARGAGWESTVVPEYRLSHPYIERIWNAPDTTWGKDPMPGPIAGLLDLVTASDPVPGKLDVFSTHDTIVAVLAGYFTGAHFAYPDYWPDFLEGVLFWQNDGEIHLRWRESEVVIGPWPVPGFQQLEFHF